MKQVSPRAAWVPEKTQLRWEVSELAPGASLTMRAAFAARSGLLDACRGAKVSDPSLTVQLHDAHLRSNVP
jgi:hypothetical protein